MDRLTSEQGRLMGNKISSFVDWDKVPVVITGTPNPKAIRLIVESIREFEIRELITSQRTVRTNENVTACAQNIARLQT
jgi:hypothetical protein